MLIFHIFITYCCFYAKQNLLLDESTSEQELKTVWVIGSSIVKHAFVEARRSYDGCSLGLQRKQYRVWWQGKGGMTWGELLPRIRFLLNIESPPSILVIHCGGNSIGSTSLFDLRNFIKDDLLKIKKMLPHCKIVWSQILPRRSWRFSKNAKALNFVAARLNNYAAWLCIRLGGSYVKYPEITWNIPGMFAADGVHLSYLGNCFFLFNLQSALLNMT